VRVNPARCGYWAFQTESVDGRSTQLLKNANDTLAARAYARSCYKSGAASAACSLYPQQSLSYTLALVACPFGQDPAGEAACLLPGNQALQVDTGLLDTNNAFGINSRQENRVQICKVNICSPFHAINYVDQALSGTTGDSSFEFSLGPINGSSPTFSYNTNARFDRITYQMFSIHTWNEYGWLPIEALQVRDGDVSVHFMAANSVAYRQPVEGLWFAAHEPSPTAQAAFANSGTERYRGVCSVPFQPVEQSVPFVPWYRLFHGWERRKMCPGRPN
jgi:hypothetical protein